MLAHPRRDVTLQAGADGGGGPGGVCETVWRSQELVVTHQQTPTFSTTSSDVARWRRLSAVATVVVLAALSGAADCLDDLEAPPCEANCAIEAECEFRTLAACEAASCNSITGAPLQPSLAACLGAAENCLEAAACPCADGCGKVEECGADADPGCEATCDTLVDQQPTETYLENVCRLESSCEDQAVCSSVSG